MTTRRAWWRWTIAGAVILVAALGIAVALAVSGGAASADRGRGVAFAAATCGGASLAGWAFGRWSVALAAGAATNRRPLAVAVGLCGIVARLAPLLAALAWLQSGLSKQRPETSSLLLGFYLPLLATDILLTIMGDRNNRDVRTSHEAN